MTEVIPGIYQLRIPTGNFPPGHVNAYLVRKSNKFIIIDTGWDTEEVLSFLQEQLGEFGASIKDIAQIVLTHGHTDHSGLAGRLRRLSGAQIYLHKREVDVIKSRFICADNVSRDNFLQQVDELLRTYGVPDIELAEPEVMLPEMTLLPFPDVTLNGGETISAGVFNFQVICTPGHSPGHISLYEPTQKVLFAGDHILPTIVPSVGLHLQHNFNPLGDFLDSLNMIKGLEVNLVLPGHEQPFTNLIQRIEELVRCHEQKITEIRGTIADGKPKTAYQISVALSCIPGTGRSGRYKLSPWDKRFAVLETIAHLESMRLGGEIERFSSNNTIHYQPFA